MVSQQKTWDLQSYIAGNGVEISQILSDGLSSKSLSNVGKEMELSSMLAAVKKVWTSAFVPASEVRQKYLTQNLFNLKE